MLLRVESSSKALISLSFALHMYQFDLVLYVCMKHCDNVFLFTGGWGTLACCSLMFSFVFWCCLD